MITETAARLISDWPLGFVATADADGRPNLSPKGMFAVIDAATLAFADIRSPGTLANLAVRPEVEINFIDILSRRGVRIGGRATIHERGTSGFDRLIGAFEGSWPALQPRIGALVSVAVTACRPLASPVYDDGTTTERSMREMYMERITALNAAALGEGTR
ncbi:MAG: pyridoxamine 5'-phosphate oxidase family protein [Rhodobacteraceae bacterium]|nr:pyridoxamine 5'-phosphate oxidase family protein [Paracoccaceae bacterium]